MTDPSDPRNIPGADAAANSFATATKSMQTFASEMQRMTSESIENTTKMMDKLRGAKTMEDVVQIQTQYMQQSFSAYADYTRKFSEMMMGVPMEMAKQGRSAFQQGTEAMTKATEHMTDNMQRAGEQMKHQD